MKLIKILLFIILFGLVAIIGYKSKSASDKYNACFQQESNWTNDCYKAHASQSEFRRKLHCTDMNYLGGILHGNENACLEYSDIVLNYGIAGCNAGMYLGEKKCRLDFESSSPVRIFLKYIGL